MNRALLLLFVVLMYLYTTGNDADRFVTKSAHLRLKMALNRGAHDASLQVEAGHLAEGRVVFDRPLARDRFLQGLAYNLQLDAGLQPEGGTLFRAAPQIVFEDYVDESIAGITFPISYVREDQQIVKVLKGPAVVYRIRIKLPRTQSWSYDGYVYKTVIYEYPLRDGLE